MNTPFEIGQVFWAPRTHAEKITVPCPCCSGTKVVELIYGDGEHVLVDCEACGLGFEGSRGYIHEYDLTPAATQFTIKAVTGLYDGRWQLLSTAGESSEFGELCGTEDEALAVSRVKCARAHERNMQSHMHSRSRAKHSTWTVQYHKKCIAGLEEQLTWHKDRINAKKVTR
jgi:hypothetical protein